MMCQILTKQPWRCDYLCSLKKQIIKSMTLQKNPCCVFSGFHISVILLGILKGENQKRKSWEKGFEMCGAGNSRGLVDPWPSSMSLSILMKSLAKMATMQCGGSFLTVVSSVVHSLSGQKSLWGPMHLTE